MSKRRSTAYIVAAATGGKVRRCYNGEWCVEARQKLAGHKTHYAVVSPDGKLLAVIGGDGEYKPSYWA